MRPEEDAIDVREVGLVLKRGARWIAVGAAGGVALALIVTLLLPRRYEATSTILVRSAESSRSALSILTGGAGGLGDLLPGGSPAGVDTELAILTSRTVMGAVVDSLGLQARVVRPSGTPLETIVTELRVLPDIEPVKYSFEKDDGGYAVRGPAYAEVTRPGAVVTLPEGRLTLRSGTLPEAFTIELRGREDVITRHLEALDASNPGGEVLQMDYSAGDPVRAAAVPNALIQSYLSRRTSTDRGVNSRRYEFLLQKEDSIANELAVAESQLRGHQEATGVFDPVEVGAAELEQGMTLRAEAEALDVEIRSLESALASIERGGGARELAAYPTFLQNPAINDLLSRLFEQETEMLILLERRTEEDPEVQVLAGSIEHLEAQLLSLARDYLAGLRRQRAEFARELVGFRDILTTLPAQAQQSYRLEREVRRLAETQLLMQAQLIDARLAAITEGGDVRQIDAAVPPEKPSSPSLPLNVAIGLLGGLVLGTMGALGRGYFGRMVTDPWDAELVAGIPALSLSDRVPLLLGGMSEHESIIVLPVGPEVRSGGIARLLAVTAVEQGRSVAVVDLESSDPALVVPPAQRLKAPSGNGAVEGDGDASATARSTGAGYAVYHGHPNGTARALVDDLEQRFSIVVVALPDIGTPGAAGVLSGERPVILVARRNRLTRAELRESVTSLQRAGIVTAGLILAEPGESGARGD